LSSSSFVSNTRGTRALAGLHKIGNYCREQIDLKAAITDEKDPVDELGFTRAELEE